jgi:hypothetical protein
MVAPFGIPGAVSTPQSIQLGNNHAAPRRPGCREGGHQLRQIVSQQWDRLLALKNSNEPVAGSRHLLTRQRKGTTMSRFWRPALQPETSSTDVFRLRLMLWQTFARK